MLPIRLAKTLLSGCLGAAAGYVATRGAFSFACYFVDHTSLEALLAGVSECVFTMAFGIIGAIYGFAAGTHETPWQSAPVRSGEKPADVDGDFG